MLTSPPSGSCSSVWTAPASPPLSPLYPGPFLVLERHTSSLKLQVGTWQKVVNISRLKPAFTPSDASPAQPPARGRPRKHPVPPPVPPSTLSETRSPSFIRQAWQCRASFFSHSGSHSTNGTTHEIPSILRHLPLRTLSTREACGKQLSDPTFTVFVFAPLTGSPRPRREEFRFR